MSVKPALMTPPAKLGILGGGQLGRMFTLAAKEMGYHITVLDPDPQAPAAEFADLHICAAYDDATALKQLAQCAAVTIEFENINIEALRWLEQFVPVSPSADCVAIAQDRELEKSHIRQVGLATAPYRIIHTEQDINEHCLPLLPAILKTATLGYDGKGQIQVTNLQQLREAFKQLKQKRCILEKKLDLRAEISVIVNRLDSQHNNCFPVAENQHHNGILAYSIIPARLPESVLLQACSQAKLLAEKMNYRGVLAVEFFVIGETHQLVVNEIAPRPHNSGHYTIDACTNSQFQQQVRIMCGIAPAQTDLFSPCCMANILGDVWLNHPKPDWKMLLQNQHTHLHLYGKKEARPARKMGHFTVLGTTATDALHEANALHQALSSTPIN